MQQAQGLTCSADRKTVMNFDPLLLGLIEIAQASGLRMTRKIKVGTILNRQHRLTTSGSGDGALAMTVENRLTAHRRV